MRRFRVAIRDGEVAGIAFGDPVRPLQVLFLHANGFNAITYQSLLDPLGGIAHAGAIDLRGHGRTTLPASPKRLTSWNRYRDDVIQVLEATAPGGLILSGHSMGATVALLVAGKRPDLVKGVILADPVLLPGEYYTWSNIPVLNMIAPANAMSKQALRRRRDFASPADAADALRGRGPFRTWRTPFLDDFVIDGVLRQDDGGYVLACAPEWEAASFNAHRIQPWGAIRKLRKARIPVIILQAERDSTAQPDTDERVHAVRPDAAVTRVPGTTHFLPMERPYVVRDAIRLVFEATMEGGDPIDYVGAVRRTINDSVGLMS